MTELRDLVGEYLFFDHSIVLSLKNNRLWLGLPNTLDNPLFAASNLRFFVRTGYWDTVSVRIVDDRTVEIISKKARKVMYTETDTVSADGNTLTKVMKDTTEDEAVTFESDFRRIAPAPTGAHALSGSWQVFKQSRSANSTIIKYKCTSQGFSAETPLGEKLEAKFDGKLYEWKTTLVIRWSR